MNQETGLERTQIVVDFLSALQLDLLNTNRTAAKSAVSLGIGNDPRVRDLVHRIFRLAEEIRGRRDVILRSTEKGEEHEVPVLNPNSQAL